MVYLGQEGYYSNPIHTWKILNPQLAGAKTKEKKITTFTFYLQVQSLKIPQT